MWSFLFTRTFRKSFLSIDPSARNKIEAFIEKHRDGMKNPTALSNFAALTNKPGFGRFRFGKYRVGVFLDFDAKIIQFRFVGARGDFYKHFPKR